MKVVGQTPHTNVVVIFECFKERVFAIAQINIFFDQNTKAMLGVRKKQSCLFNNLITPVGTSI